MLLQETAESRLGQSREMPKKETLVKRSESRLEHTAAKLPAKAF